MMTTFVFDVFSSLIFPSDSYFFPEGVRVSHGFRVPLSPMFGPSHPTQGRGSTAL